MGRVVLPTRGVAALLLMVSCIYNGAAAVSFYLEPGKRRCFTEELPLNAKVTGTASVASGKSDMEVDVWITTFSGQVLYHKRATSHGKFSFTTPAVRKTGASGVNEDEDDEYASEEEDTYRVCLEHQQPASRSHPAGTRRLVSFHLDHAFNALYRGDRHAQVEDVDQLDRTMRQIHTSLLGMIGDLSRLEKRERDLMARIQSTTGRVTKFSIVALAILFGTSALQYKYYSTYFKQKKLV